MKNKVLIDADSLVYILGWDVKDLPNDPENYPTVIQKTDEFAANILNACGAEFYLGFLKGSQPTFRHIANPQYKANRKTGTNDWLNAWDAVIKHRLVTYWKFIQVEGMEAEDAVSIMARVYSLNGTPDLVLAHIDKDLNQIPGKHYDYKKLIEYDITPDEATYNLFTQVLVGDSTDNLPGLGGVGKVGAKNILAHCQTTLQEVTLNAFITKLGERDGIIAFYESYLMCKLLDAPCMGFDPSKMQWIGYVPIDNTLPETGSPDKYDENLFKLPTPKQ